MKHRGAYSMEKIKLKNVEVEICHDEYVTGVGFWYKGMYMFGSINLQTFNQIKQWETIGEPLRD